MDEHEIEERLSLIESELQMIKRAMSDEGEERWRVMGTLHAALEEVRSAVRRLDEWSEMTDGEVRRVTSSIRAAGSAFSLPYGGTRR